MRRLTTNNQGGHMETALIDNPEIKKIEKEASVLQAKANAITITDDASRRKGRRSPKMG